MTVEFSDDRRTFLRALALVSGAAACVPLAKEAVASGKQAPISVEKSSQGYRETAHINKYYQTARS